MVYNPDWIDVILRRGIGINDDELLACLREVVPMGTELDDPHTADAARVNDVHRLLYSRDTPNWERDGE